VVSKPIEVARLLAAMEAALAAPEAGVTEFRAVS
jgi:hypothetical protein